MGKKKDPVRDYSRELPTAAPDWLRAWAENRTWERDVLLFSAGWYRDPLTGIKERCADVTCSACRRTFKADWISGGGCRGWGYGPSVRWFGTEMIREHQMIECPECGRRGELRHRSGNNCYGAEGAWPMTLFRVPEAGHKDRLGLLQWNVEKYFDRDMRRHIWLHPAQAYVLEENRMLRCNRVKGGMNGQIWYDDWHQVGRCTDEARLILETVCPEGIAAATKGTVAENSKLELYMENERACFPAAYLKLWQKHRNVETLLTSGAGDILRALIGQEKVEGAAGTSQDFSNAWVKLPTIEWKQKRPSAMLGLNREELRQAVELQERENLGGATWETLIELHRRGLAKLEDGPIIERLLGQQPHYRKPKVTEAAERAGRVSRVATYLAAQERRWPKDKPELFILMDYWHMAEEQGLDLTNREILWPERLKREHDRCVANQKHKEQEALRALFRRREEQLAGLSWERDGLFIRPPKSEAEMIAEGAILHHCVATYAERHAKGETAILFIRSAAAPEMPYFTLNWDEKHGIIIQNRGDRNCDPPAEVKAFAGAWAEWVRAGCPADKNEKGSNAA